MRKNPPTEKREVVAHRPMVRRAALEDFLKSHGLSLDTEIHPPLPSHDALRPWGTARGVVLGELKLSSLHPLFQNKVERDKRDQSEYERDWLKRGDVMTALETALGKPILLRRFDTFNDIPLNRKIYVVHTTKGIVVNPQLMDKRLTPRNVQFTPEQEKAYQKDIAEARKRE